MVALSVLPSLVSTAADNHFAKIGSRHENPKPLSVRLIGDKTAHNREIFSTRSVSMDCP